MEGLKPRDESRMARSTKREKRIKRERERARASEQRDKEKDTHRERERERVGTVVELGFMMVKTTVGKGIYGVTTNPWEVM